MIRNDHITDQCHLVKTSFFFLSQLAQKVSAKKVTKIITPNDLKPNGIKPSDCLPWVISSFLGEFVQFNLSVQFFLWYLVVIIKKWCIGLREAKLRGNLLSLDKFHWEPGQSWVDWSCSTKLENKIRSIKKPDWGSLFQWYLHLSPRRNVRDFWGGVNSGV